MSNKRLSVIHSHLISPSGDSSESSRVLSVNCTAASLRIGDVSIDIESPSPELAHLVPTGYTGSDDPQDVLRILRFMMQKDNLGQDIYLIGPPGGLRRELVFKYCQLVKRPIEYVALSQDTTESDLKQRREISAGTARYVDCAAVRAAINGSVLVLDGIEKAERNVMPLLNNLLENREMALEDGRFLVHPTRFDNLAKVHTSQELASWKLVRCSHRFRVIALGLPIPRYPGSALDPPFRSRFQARDVPSARVQTQLDTILDACTEETIMSPAVTALVQTSAVLSDLRHAEGVSANSAIPELPQQYERTAAQLLSLFPLLHPREILDMVYPFPSLMATSVDERGPVVDKVLSRFDLLWEKSNDMLKDVPLCGYLVKDIIGMGVSGTARIRFTAVPLNGYAKQYLESMKQGEMVVNVPAGDLPFNRRSSLQFVETPTVAKQLSLMTQAHASRDICLIGEKGGGKSVLVNSFARKLGYRVEHIPLYKDITARSLLQRRTTTPNGDTDWEDSSLVVAARLGRIAVLDGVEQMAPGTLATLQLLVSQREARLPNGDRMVSLDTFTDICNRDGISRQVLQTRGVFPIHPSFRIIALARPSGAKGGGSPTGTWKDWLGAEVQSMFSFVYIEPLTSEEQKVVLTTRAPNMPVFLLDKLMVFESMLRAAVSKDEMLSVLLPAVSLRSMIRICKRVSVEPCEETLHEALMRAALSRFLPPVVAETLKHLLHSSLIGGYSTDAPSDESLQIQVIEGSDLREDPNAIAVLKVGHVSVDILPPRDVLLIPDILFYDNPRQAMSMREMIKDWKSGQHLLLIGNQGVGKNKLADRMLQLLRLPREYIQLHRDTTVQNLTSNPTIVDGVLKYEDSPLVRAAREGRVLVVDEADKAPTHVTAILKALVEDRSMLLSDGRRILDQVDYDTSDDEHASGAGADIILHPDFRLIALANRPGFPFHGNDFFREVGDVFACHAIDNPDSTSEMFLLEKYGPDVARDTLRKLIGAFDELRRMSDDGQLSYPYSTRELTAIVKHMQLYPDDGVDKILRNVFDFDNYSIEEKQLLIEVFAKHGVPFSIGSSAFHVNTGRSRPLPPPKLLETWSLTNHAGKSHHAFQVSTSVAPLSKILRMNQNAKCYMWKLKPPTHLVNLTRNERSSTVFTEELYNFHLPQGLVVGVSSLPDNSFVSAIRSHSFLLFHVDPTHARCVVHDLHAALPADGVYRVAPKSANVFSMSGSINTFESDTPGKFGVIVQNPTSGNLMAIDLSTKQFVFAEIPPGCQRNGPKIQMIQSAANPDRFLLYQRDYKYITVIDFAISKVWTTTLTNDKGELQQQIPFGIELIDALDENSWIVTSSTGEVFHLYLDADTSNFIFETLDRRQATLEQLKTSTVPVFAGSSMSKPPGALKSARLLQLKQNGTQERIPVLAVQLPEAFNSGSSASLFQIDQHLQVLDTETTSKVHCQYLDQGGQLAVIRESSERMVVSIDLYDVSNASRRTIQVTLEDDVLSNDDPDLRLRGSTDPGTGNKVVYSPNLHNLTKSLSPTQLNFFAMRRTTMGEAHQKMFVIELSPSSIATIDCLGWVRVFLINDTSIRQAFADWRKLVGKADEQPLRILLEDDGKGGGDADMSEEEEANSSGDGKGNGDGDGSGDGNGSGSGGSSGGQTGGQTGNAKGKSSQDISELPDPSDDEFQEITNPRAAEIAEKSTEVLESVKQASSELKREEWQKLLKQLDMTEHDAEKYDKYKESVKTEIRELRVVLEGLEARQAERVWLRNQSTGDIDDMKLIDGLTGERSIYKRRSEQSPDSSMHQPLPKRMHFVFDLSMSMSRYSADGRLQRSLEAAVMILEALKGFEHKFDIKMTGHSGDSKEVPLVEFGAFPKNDKERLTVIKKMHAHAEMCDSGDNTVEGVKQAIETITRKEADDYYVFCISDANLDQYSIKPAHFERLFAIERRVHAFVIFIASMGDQTKAFEEKLQGRVFTCLDKTAIPKTLKKMFLAAASKGSSL